MRFRAAIILCLSLVLLGTPGIGRAQESQPSEYQIKAAFIFNFAKFIEWPAQTFTNETAPFIIGVLGDNPFGPILAQTVQGKSVNGRSFEVQEFKPGSEPGKCHILFISTSEKKRIADLGTASRTNAVLTVGETDQFTETGGMINFVVVSNKLRFQINDNTAKAAGLKISSKLLNLALRPAS